MKRAMTCAEVEELLGAYALDALLADDRAAVEEHLRSCAEHETAAQELRHVTPLLALTADEREPSPELRRRIVNALKNEPQLPERQAPATPPAPERRGSAMRWRFQPRVAALALAAIVLLAVGAAIGHLTTQPTLNQQVVAYTFHGNSLAPGAQARLVYFKDQQQAVLDVTGLPALRAGHVYEIWLFQGAKPIDVGVAATDGELVARLDRNLGQYQQLAITMEPGEQIQPTTNPILVGRLS
jgi:anti-sigma-K factor RskA